MVYSKLAELVPAKKVELSGGWALSRDPTWFEVLLVRAVTIDRPPLPPLPLYSVWGPPEHTHGGGRRSTASMPTHGGTDARGRCVESSAQWEGQARPLTPDSA